MATLILLSRKFEVDGWKTTLTAGVKNGTPLVVLGLLSVPFQELHNITIEYPMKTQKAALAFVVKADDDVIRRGIEKYHADIEDVADRVNRALMQPYRPPTAYVTRAQAKK